ncbi:hypothetical protein M231_07097 [Tremella mesenterica]|uniref:Uncharacterized protein n=1 Tax=Tremella mesenterica TaxID=5217 RepID=A0A4Q1BCA7_TREME|nr:hypothetical protein M231_07097 [Tremella mesenterica]
MQQIESELHKLVATTLGKRKATGDRESTPLSKRLGGDLARSVIKEMESSNHAQDNMTLVDLKWEMEMMQCRCELAKLERDRAVEDRDEAQKKVENLTKEFKNLIEGLKSLKEGLRKK